MEKNIHTILPPAIRHDKNISHAAKILYGEIFGLSNKVGYCWAHNKHFADLLNTTPRTVQRYINELIENKYLFRVYKNIEKENINTSKRCLTVNENTKYFDLLASNDDKNYISPMTTATPQLRQNSHPNHDSGVIYNNTKKNTINNTLNIHDNNCDKKPVIAKANEEERKIIKLNFNIYKKIISDYTQNAELEKMVNDFVEMRSEINKPLTSKGLKLILRELDKLAKNDEDKIAVLEQSIVRSYVGIYAVNHNPYSKNNASSTGVEKTIYNSHNREYTDEELELLVDDIDDLDI